MPDPMPYVPSFDFTASDKGPELNVQLSDVAEATNQLVQALQDVRRSDGALQNGIVTAESLAPSAIAAFGPNGDLAAQAVLAAEDAADAAAASAITAADQANLAANSANTASGHAQDASDFADAAEASAIAAAASAAALPVAFAAHRNGVDQTGVVTGTPTKFAAGTEVFDQGGFYDAANARWTPSAGRYRLTACCMFTAAVVDQQQFRAMIYKNGSLLKQSVVVASGTAALSAIVSCVDVANGTDFYEFFVQGAGAGDKTVSGSAANSWFEGSAL